MRKLVTGLACLAALSVAACKGDTLSVPDGNSPDIARSYSTPSTLDGLIATNFAQIHKGIFGTSSGLDPMMQVESFESYATVANFSMQLREALPRTFIDNSRNNFSFVENDNDFAKLAQQARYAANYIQALDALTKSGGHLGNVNGTPSNDTITLPGQDLRARSFAFFNNGVALGLMSLGYDSAAITISTTDPSAVPPLSSYTLVNQTAIKQLDSALAISNLAKAAAGFPLPANYFNLPGGNISLAQYQAIIHSFRARIEAEVARTPVERAAVNWAAVLNDTQNGIAADLVIQISSSAGWPLSWLGSQMFASSSAGWHQLPLMIFGMSDSTGAYDTWIKQNLGSRQEFLVQTQDKRWPAGATRAAQQASNQTTWVYNKYPYIRNRTVADTPGDAWGQSYYDFYRFDGIVQSGNGTGPWIEFAKVENDMLEAEAYLRQSTPDYASAAALINKSRTAAGLSPVLGQADGGLSGASCVPRVPNSTSTGTQCGNLFEAMKYEKRMETAYTGYGQWFFDGRGWGDLPVGTPLHWPVPYQEMDTRTHPFYNLGGVGGKDAAVAGTYGF